MMQPNINKLIHALKIETPIVGLYDAPTPEPFEPIIEPSKSGHVCLFAFYKKWARGQTLRLTLDNYGCGGAGYWLFGIEQRSREDFVKFLADDEALKCNHELMNQWLNGNKPYNAVHENLLIGPLKAKQWDFLKTVTFFVNPDQLSALTLAGQYYASQQDPEPTIAPFGSGCGQLLPLFKKLEKPQAIIGATDIAMRKYLKHHLLAFTVTKTMFSRLCSLDDNSFISKKFWQTLQSSRQRKK